MSKDVDNSFKNESLNIIEFSVDHEKSDIDAQQSVEKFQINHNIQNNQINREQNDNLQNKIYNQDLNDLEMLQFDQDDEIYIEKNEEIPKNIQGNYEPQSHSKNIVKQMNFFQPIQQEQPLKQIQPEEPIDENAVFQQNEEQFQQFQVALPIQEQNVHSHQKFQNFMYPQNDQPNDPYNQNQDQQRIQIQSQQIEQEPIMIPQQIYPPNNQLYPQQNQYYQDSYQNQIYPDQIYQQPQNTNCTKNQNQQLHQQQQNGCDDSEGSNQDNEKKNKKKKKQKNEGYYNRNMIIIPITSAQEQEDDKDDRQNGGVTVVSNISTYCCFGIFDRKDNCCQWICDCIINTLSFPIILIKLLIQCIWNNCLHHFCEFCCPDLDQSCSEGCQLIVYNVGRCCRGIKNAVDGCCQLSISYVCKCINCVAITHFFLELCDTCAESVKICCKAICYGILICFQFFGNYILSFCGVCCTVFGEYLGTCCTVLGGYLGTCCQFIVQYMEPCCKLMCEICGFLLKFLK